MVILRVWTPLSSKEKPTGYASIALSNVQGGAYMSVRAVKATDHGREIVRSATLGDDVDAAGAEAVLTWKFTRLNEARMLRIWDQYRTATSVEMREFADARTRCFLFCDWALAAGRGYEVDEPSAAPLRRRAQGALIMSTLANSHSALASRADHYLTFERW